MRYAEVAVNAPTAARRTFSYSIPPSLDLVPGHAVWVPFGARILQGIVFDLSDQPAVEETRPVAELVDSRPALSRHQIELARWIGDRYLAPYFSAAALMLPPGFERKALTYFYPVPGEAHLPLTAPQREVLHLLKRKGRLEKRELQKALGKRQAEVALGQLYRKGLLRKVGEWEKPRVRPRTVTYFRLTVGPEEAAEAARRLEGKGAQRQAQLLRLLLEAGGPVPGAAGRLRPHTAALSALIEKGLVAREERPQPRDPLSGLEVQLSAPPPLAPDQEKAWQEIRASLLGESRTRVFLLHGVTGSGKTELYLHALAQAVALGKRGLLLVPEIALTPQLTRRFASRFPGRVAVLHSQLSLGEQFDEWHRIREGAFDVVIGSRGAIFAPQPDLGLIVMDEEHEWTYKQEDLAPRYHAREAALKIAELSGATVILGSATPDVESYYRARRGDFWLLELPQRVSAAGPGELPRVEVVDLRREEVRGLFSRRLIQVVAETLEAGEQVILFLNRRGMASVLQCRDCGLALRCRRCSITLTYHTGEVLLCHQCNYRTPVPRVCPQCFSHRLRFMGAGTEKVEEEVGHLFPGARLLRWDRDVTRGRRSHEAILSRFLAHEADILIGTQMIAKGLDLPEVTLVGVVLADIGLNLPDYRAGERTFQLLVQVAGRAGRSSRGGRVIIQTYSPDHYAVQAAAAHDYASFFQQELEFRRHLGLPPFSRLARLLYLHTSSQRGQEEAERLCRLLREERDLKSLAVEILGPSPAYPYRVRGRYRWQILLRGEAPGEILSRMPLPQGWVVDIDPVSLL